MSRGMEFRAGWRIPKMKQQNHQEESSESDMMRLNYRSRCCVDDFLCRQITFVAYE